MDIESMPVSDTITLCLLTIHFEQYSEQVQAKWIHLFNRIRRVSPTGHRSMF